MQIGGAHAFKKGSAALSRTPDYSEGSLRQVYYCPSFRLIRFQGARPVSYTYKKQPTAPIPFGREGPPPVRVTYDPPNDGSHAQGNATFENDLEENLTKAKAVFVLRRGDY